VILTVLLAVSPLPAVVVSEIHYHPPLGQEQLEFLEITNDAWSPEDISGWALVKGIAFEFPPRTILEGRQSIVICADVDAVRSHYGIDNAVGNYQGKLDGSGERLTLVNHVGVVVQTVQYRDEGKWPVAPDGTGHSLVLRSLNLDPSEPESWSRSQALGGDPGQHDRTTVTQTLSFNELFRGSDGVLPSPSPQDGGWVEIFNAGSAARDVSGWTLTDDPDRNNPHVFAAGTTIPAGGFLVVEEQTTTLALSAPRVQLFLSSPQGLVEAAFTFDRAPPNGLAPGEYSEALWPDGGWPDGDSPNGGVELWVTPTPTPGSENDVPRVTDLVINEIFYHPPEDRAGEFLELFNRGAQELDISGFSFSKGIGYTFPAGTSLAPGASVVLTDDPQIIEERYGVVGALGWSQGVLSNAGENLRLVDCLGNLVDEVRYFEGGAWPVWADGRGSSLELIDPLQDNDFASAWGASDETEKSVWEQHSFAVPEYETTPRPELHLLLVERGACRIDDVSIVEQPEAGAGNYIPNPGFEEDTLPWLIEGTHVASERITHDAHSGEACLELVATGKGDSRCNRIETDTEPSLEAGRAYEVSLWTRWLRGSNLLVVHGQFSRGPFLSRQSNLSGNPLGFRVRMSVPEDLGTPGAENSLRLELREKSGSDNLGPVMTDVVHAPASPEPGLPVTVRARVSDSDGVASVHVFFKRDAPDGGPFQSVQLLQTGRTYTGEIPSLSAETGQVSYYVEARDFLDAATRFPREAPDGTLLYRTEGSITERLQVFLSAQSQETLATRPIHSNDLVEGTAVLDGEQVYYGVGVRYRGSTSGRPKMEGIRVRFPDDRRFRQKLRDINLTNRDRKDGAAYAIVGRSGTAAKPVAVPDYKYIRASFNGVSMGNPGIFEPIDRDFMQKWYGATAAREGVVLKAQGRHYFNDNCGVARWDEATLTHRGENVENYRFYFFHGTNQTLDNWKPLIDGTRVLDPETTPDEEFDQLFESVVDVEAFLSVFMPRVLMHDVDTIFSFNGHNGYIFWEPTDSRWRYLPFDMGSAWNSFPPSFLLFSDIPASRVVLHPRTLRLYYRMIHEYMQGYWSVEAAGPFLDALEQAAGVGAEMKTYIAGTKTLYESWLEEFLSAELSILTNNGEDFTADTPAVTLDGQASVLISSFQLRRNDGAPQPFEPTWNSATTWSAPLILSQGTNRIEILGFDADQGLAGSVAITISRTGADFIRGDANGDLSLNVLDAIRTILFLFQGASLPCPDAADFDDTGAVNITDAVGILGYLFSHAAPPPPPFPPPGGDPTPDPMECGP
jgi:hypothetical protein